MSQFELLPLSQPRDFDAVFSSIEEAYLRQGGATMVASGESNISLVDDEAMRRDTQLSNYSTFLIPYGTDPTEAHAYDPAHAFSRGFSMAYPVNDVLYENRYGFDDYYSSLNQWMLAQGTENIVDDRAWFEANSLLVRKYSEGGLALLGTSSTDVIEEWGDRLYTNPTLSRVFTMGCGALVMSGVIHQRSLNEYALNTAGFTASIEEGLEALMARRDGDEFGA